MVKLLIEHGAGLELRQADGATGLLNAIRLNEGKIALTLLRAGAVPKVLRRRNIRDENEALSDFIVDMINYGGWIPHVQRHRGILLGIISRFSIWNRLPHEVAMWRNERKVVLTLLRAGAAAKVSRRREIRNENAALSDFMADMINDGGWIARVQRHRDRLLGVISHCVPRLPHDVNVAILGFWSPPGGH
ncbi:spectrin binding protein [Aureococcus anophagefferens]|uniref:Spectrin binding protein n=1 Tax=Aureococcus anophagefferens TaxID=44056 RepID=A0ABR1FTK0_AURAN|nr:hypothetical protein JL720_2112 [Aureococcus anophagefferens]